MQKVIFLTESQREELEDFLENDDRNIEEYDYYCSEVAEHFGLDAADVEKVYDDLFVNTVRVWECAENYDEDDIQYDDCDDFYYVED